MASCIRCKHSCGDKDNYCSRCGMPMKPEIFKMVRDSYDKKRRRSVHSVISLLIKEGCIREDKLSDLMKKLGYLFKTQKDHQQKQDSD